ncbi:unnamed protein product [Brachionus calyciflorus]|uniref:Uncharacterized protein n=1 Tax=Brachionus calyciflorus TaxID=104777 RepID=A0A814KXN2_9BILA|nr:unnamed protein product [Brachionus calyciflorus]
MIAALLASQLSKKRRLQKRSTSLKEQKSGISDKKKPSSNNKNSIESRFKMRMGHEKIDKMELLKRYMTLMKISMISFILSTALHIGLVTGYYYTYLWLHPDDPGKKKFYSETTVQKGINIGGKIIGGGGVQTNHHKSYLMHLVREHYTGLSKIFLLQFGALYLLILSMFKFFPERAKLKEDTKKAFEWDAQEMENKSFEIYQDKTKKGIRKRVILKKQKAHTESDEYEDFDDLVDELKEENNSIVSSDNTRNSHTFESKKDI